MFAIYRVMLPLLLVVFVAMGLWVSFLHFPWEWVMYAVMGLEVCVATVVMLSLIHISEPTRQAASDVYKRQIVSLHWGVAALYAK